MPGRQRIPHPATLIIGYSGVDEPLAFNVLNNDGEITNSGDVDIGDDPEAVVNWTTGFVAAKQRARERAVGR